MARRSLHYIGAGHYGERISLIAIEPKQRLGAWAVVAWLHVQNDLSFFQLVSEAAT